MDLFTDNAEIQRPNTSHLLPDNWLATSALQKAIRRGQVDHALNATSFLLSRQPARFWRRLIVIALEDVGIGDLDLVREVLLLSGRTSWRAQNGGDWLFASSLVSQLCGSVKCRDACDALVITDLSPHLIPQRSAFLDLGDNDLCHILADGTRSLGERVLAAWLITGTKRFPAFSLPERDGSFSELLDVYRSLGVPEHVLEVARLGSTRTNEGHPLTLPLIWLLAHSAESRTVETKVGQQPRLIGGWPEYAADMHTRTGKRAIRLFLTKCESMLDLVKQHLPATAVEEFVGTLVFRAEGEEVDRRLVYPGSHALLRDAEQAHLIYQGVPANLVREALAVLYGHMDMLHSCRLEVIRGRPS